MPGGRRSMHRNLEDVLARVERGDCWVWTGAKNSRGYGVAVVAGQRGLVHRYVYTAMVGPIPDGLHLDHLCRNPICCRPDHLEPVTARENVRRGNATNKTHCKNGTHLWVPENITIRRSGHKVCRLCANAQQRAWQIRRRVADEHGEAVA